MPTTLAIIVGSLAVALALLKAGAMVVGVVRAWSADVSALRKEIAALSIDLAKSNGQIRAECWDMIQAASEKQAAALKEHKLECAAARVGLGGS